MTRVFLGNKGRIGDSSETNRLSFPPVKNEMSFRMNPPAGGEMRNLT